MDRGENLGTRWKSQVAAKISGRGENPTAQSSCTWHIPFICLLFFSCNTSDEKKSEKIIIHEENEKIVRSISRIKFNIEEKFGEPIEIFDYEEIQIFDKQGNLTEVSWYDSLGNPSVQYSGKVHKERYIYNEDNKEIRWSKFDINGDYVSDSYSSWVTIVTKYDSLGNEIERIGYDKWEDIDFRVITRTDINNVEERISYDRDNNITLEIFNKYNSQGKTIESITYGYRDKRSNKEVIKYKYNSDNKQIQMTTECNYDCFSYDYYGKLWKTYYNENGDIIEETYQYPEGKDYEDLKTKVIYKYDDRNRMIEKLNLDKNDEPISGKFKISKTVYNYLDEYTYEILRYNRTEEFGEKSFNMYWKELVKKEFYEWMYSYINREK